VGATEALTDQGLEGYVEGVAVVANDDYPELVISRHLIKALADAGLYFAIDLNPSL
jgi:hypothetical protein